MDPCNNKFTIGVGKLTKSEYLLSFQFGVEEVFSLFGVLKLRFVIICWFRILILCHKRIFYLKLDNTVPRYLGRYNLYAICCLFKMNLKIENLYLGNLWLIKTFKSKVKFVHRWVKCILWHFSIHVHFNDFFLVKCALFKRKGSFYYWLAV